MKLYPGGGEEAVRIMPKLDRLLLFWSDRRNPHEVEPSHDVRLVSVSVLRMASKLGKNSNFISQNLWVISPTG